MVVMTTPAPPAPRHARQRATPAAAARNRAAAQQQKPARQPKPPPGPPPTFAQQRAKARTAARASARSTLARRAAGPTPEGVAVYAAQRSARAGQGAARAVREAQIVPGDRQYQPVILAEFLVAVLLVALAPIAGVRSSANEGSGPSPYGVSDLKQLVAVGAAYFILALVASGNRGRLAAWFGGLVVIGIGLSKVQGGGLRAIFGMLGQGPSSAGQVGQAIDQGVQAV
jgi:hypothetical protein